MRSTTKTALGIISLGILGVSYQLGNSATASTGGFASPTTPLTVATPDSTASTTPDATQSASASASSSASGSQTAPSTKASSAPAASASASTAPSAAASAPASTGSTGTAVSKTGDAVESGFGTVQVKVTKTDGKITDITLVQANATHGRAAAFPYLVQYAVAANGANFANLSGATYTTNAFKESLRTALAKF